MMVNNRVGGNSAHLILLMKDDYMRCLILSMVPQRDWVIDTMIAVELAKRGHTSMVRNYLQDGRTAIIIEKPDVCIIPPVRCEYTRDFATRLKQWGIKVVSRRSEAGVSRKQYEKLPRRWQLDQIGRYDYKDLVDLELVWSDEFGQILVDEGKIAPDKLWTIGGITLDPYFLVDIPKELEGQRETSKEEFFKKHAFDMSKKTILFSTGFVNADHPEYVLPEAPAGDPIHNELYERDRSYRIKWVNAINWLRANTDFNILVRPHQGEDLDEYKLSPGVYLSSSECAADVLINCDCLIHAGSTMSMEAHLLNKPAFNFGNTAQDELIRDISPVIETKEELLETLLSIDYTKSNATIHSIEDLSRHFYGPIDGKAYKRVADAVCEFEPNPNKNIPDVWPEEELKDYSTEGIIKIKNALITNCSVCKKPFQNFTGRERVPCPHCGISITVNPMICH